MQAITPKSMETPFRYLGLYLNMALTWKKQISIMSLLITEWGMKILRARVSAIKALETYKILLLPKLDLGLTFADIESKVLKGWSRRIIKYIFKCDHRPTNLLTSLSIEAFSELTNCTLICERYWSNKLKEFVYNLNSPSLPVGKSTYARLHSLLGKPGLSFYETKLTKRYSMSRFAKLIEYFRSNNVLIVAPSSGIKFAYEHVKQILDMIKDVENVRIFTDGSTFPGKHTSGIGIHIENMMGNKIANYNFAITSNGDNFHAEMVGLTVAAWVGHRMKNWEIYTDSLSSLTMINKSRSQRDWIRTPSRGWVKRLKDFLNQNPAIKLIS